MGTVTVQNIIDQVKRDSRETFTATSSNNALIDYVNRVQQMLLRRRRWDWMLSEPQRFVTERGQLDYWLGPSPPDNILEDPEEFSVSGWTKTNVTVTTNATTGPRRRNAARLLEAATTTQHGVSQAVTDLTHNRVYQVVIAAKAGERTFLFIRTVDRANNDRKTWFDLAGGTVGTTAAAHLATIDKLPFGFYACRVQFDAGTGTTTPLVEFRIATADNDAADYLGVVTSGLFVAYASVAEARAGVVDTNLNLTDIRQVVRGTALSRTRDWQLHPVESAPQGSWQNPDASFEEDEPTLYKNVAINPNILSLYPAPDAGSDYEIEPPAPHSTTAAGGALAARTYFLRTTFVDKAGNSSLASTTARQYVVASKLITVKAPQPPVLSGSAGILYDRWDIYASTTEGSETKQNATPVNTTADWTEPASGLTTTGAAVPSTSDIDPLRGYVIEFQYYKAHSHLTLAGDFLLIPDDYRDVVVAGVNWLAASYLGSASSALWRATFEEGVAGMVRDQNPWPGGALYMKPDSRSYISRSASTGREALVWWNPDPS